MNTRQVETNGSLLSKGLRYIALSMVAVGLVTYCSPELLKLLPQHYSINEIPYQKTTVEEIYTHFDDYKEQPVMVTVIPHKYICIHRDKPAILQGSGIIASETIVLDSKLIEDVQLEIYFCAYQNDPAYATHAQTLKKLCEEKVPLTIRGYVFPKKVNDEENVTNAGTAAISRRKVTIITLNGQDMSYTLNGIKKQLAIATDSDSIEKAILQLNPLKNRDKLR